MHKHGLTLIFGLLFAVISAVAQPTGYVTGTVICDDGVPASGAVVRLDSYLPPFHSVVQAGANGSFEWSGLESGVYFFTAMRMGDGFDFDSRFVAGNDTNTVILALEVPPGDTLTETYVRGTTVIEPPNAEHALPWYFVDVNGDQVNDYRLSFGPSWYDPPYVHRPLNGSDVGATGGLFGYAAEPTIIVYSLADTIWRNPDEGHGGYGGSQEFFSLVCHTLDTSGTSGLSNPERVELKGTGVFDLCGPDTTTPPGVYEFAATPGSWDITHHLNFGMDRVVPFDLMDTLFVVGGLVEVPEDRIPWVIVYEVDGEFWREPGDTTGLAPMGPQAADDPLILPPSSFDLSAYPNPFNATTTFAFTLPQAGHISLRLFDLLGQEVERIASGPMDQGEHRIQFSAERLTSGIYFARLESSASTVTTKLVILK